MNSEQIIQDLLKQNEDEQLEFKERVNKDQIGSIICSFLNNKGGQILIGVSDKKEVIGIKDAEKFQKELESFLINEIVPEAPITVSVEKYHDKELILIKVWAGSNQPYIFNGTIFYRRGERTIKASSKNISELIHNRQLSEVHWERRPVLGVEIEDLDLEEIQKTITSTPNYNKDNQNIKTPLDFLSHYGLFKNGNFTNAAVILFGKTPAKFIPQARVRISFLSNGKTGNEFIDDKVLEGNFFHIIDDIINFLKKNLSHISKFSEKSWLRKDDFIYPMSALREGILNALVHRDYSSVSSSASIIIYSDRLEITNTGHLQLKISDLKKFHSSILINPDIAHITFLRGYIEKIGRGTLKILEACENANLKSPEWTIDNNTVKLTFFNKVESKGIIQNISEGLNKIQSEIANKGLIRVLAEADELARKEELESKILLEKKKELEEIKIRNAIQKTIEESIKGVTDIVKNRLVQLVQMIFKNPGIKTKEFIRELNVSERTIKENLKLLIDSKIVFYQGSNKTGGYYLDENYIKKIKS